MTYDELNDFYDKWREETIAGIEILICQTCGSVVMRPQLKTHEQWHRDLPFRIEYQIGASRG